MSEFFLELYSEEMPPRLQIDAREIIKKRIEDKLNEIGIKFNSSYSYSTPTRLVFFIKGLPDKIEQKEKILKGPKVDAPEAALQGFIKSNNLNQSNIYKKEIEKGLFYFGKIKKKIINVRWEFQKILPQILSNYVWKKSMKWSNYDIEWGRPLKSILALFNNKLIEFDFFHIKSGNYTFSENKLENKIKKISNFSSYLNFLKSQKIILNQEERKNKIINKINKICNSRKLKKKFNEKLIEEVVNLVDRPHVILGKFDKEFLKIPHEILILTMQRHQKYFPAFNENDELTNLFFVVINQEDEKNFIKIGNERVISARLSDAKFFWNKNLTENLVKQIVKLKTLSFFNNLGSVYDKTQRLKKLGAFISNNLNLNKEKVEIASSVCKADLVSDIVAEYPELQGIMGKYFSQEQGFDKEVSIAIGDHYLPVGIDSPVPKKPISCAVAIVDKVDTLVGFFGINEKPTSSKDPYALRRSAIGLLRIIIENNLNIQLKDLINYSIIIYQEQNLKFSNKMLINDILIFLKDRAKNFLKFKKIRPDIIEAAISNHTGDNFLFLYKKCKTMNNNISKDIGKNIITTYKRVSSILDLEIKKEKETITGQPDTILFKKDEEKNLFDKINEIRKYFSTSAKDEKYEQTLEILSGAKPTADEFFNNVIVNDNDSSIKKNRLELLKLFCKTYNNFIDFSKVEGAN